MADQPTNEIPGLHLHQTLRGHTDVITKIAWSPDGKMLASASKDGTVRLWNGETGELEQTTEHSVPITTTRAGIILFRTG